MRGGCDGSRHFAVEDQPLGEQEPLRDGARAVARADFDRLSASEPDIDALLLLALGHPQRRGRLW